MAPCQLLLLLIIIIEGLSLLQSIPPTTANKHLKHNLPYTLSIYPPCYPLLTRQLPYFLNPVNYPVHYLDLQAEQLADELKQIVHAESVCTAARLQLAK